jgi:hypothetical protein
MESIKRSWESRKTSSLGTAAAAKYVQDDRDEDGDIDRDNN